MKIIVTGGAGFIGSHLVDELVELGAEVHVLDNLVAGETKHVNPCVKMYVVDICSKEAKELFHLIKPDIVFHLAAQADVGKSVLSPQYDADVNIRGTINMLEASRDTRVKKFIFASTSAVYGNLRKDFLTEHDNTIPASYYGLSKLTAESYIKLFYELYRLPYTILRYANVYGPRQLPKGEGGVVAVFIDRLKSENTLRVHGDGEQTRDFIYVKDIVSANIQAMNYGEQEIIQISTFKKTAVNDVISKLTDIHGEHIQTVFTVPREGDIKHSCLSNEKAQNLLKWQPSVNLLNGLEETYKFYVE